MISSSIIFDYWLKRFGPTSNSVEEQLWVKVQNNLFTYVLEINIWLWSIESAKNKIESAPKNVWISGM